MTPKPRPFVFSNTSPRFSATKDNLKLHVVSAMVTPDFSGFIWQKKTNTLMEPARASSSDRRNILPGHRFWALRNKKIMVVLQSNVKTWGTELRTKKNGPHFFHVAMKNNIAKTKSPTFKNHGEKTMFVSTQYFDMMCRKMSNYVKNWPKINKNRPNVGLICRLFLFLNPIECQPRLLLRSLVP